VRGLKGDIQSRGERLVVREILRNHNLGVSACETSQCDSDSEFKLRGAEGLGMTRGDPTRLGMTRSNSECCGVMWINSERCVANRNDVKRLGVTRIYLE
jgi:hypothetical protein